MPQYQYRVIAAPNRENYAQDAPLGAGNLAAALEETMNTMAVEGWEYQRAETLPCVEQSAYAPNPTTWQNVLVFRREMTDSATAAKPRRDVLQLTDPVLPITPLPTPMYTPSPAPEITAPQHPDDDASQSAGASRMLSDNGVEELSEVSGISSSLRQLSEIRKASKSME